MIPQNIINNLVIFLTTLVILLIIHFILHKHVEWHANNQNYINKPIREDKLESIEKKLESIDNKLTLITNKINENNK